MTSRPILFSGPMVRALLAGRKTQTRRVVKDSGLYAIDAFVHGAATAERERFALAQRCPYGLPGDRLWVRETYAIMGVDCRRVSVARAERMPPGKTLADTDGGLEVIEVSTKDAWWAEKRIDCERWKPAIFMPRWACRLELEVTGVRVERLQDISRNDAIAEGIDSDDYGPPPEPDYEFEYVRAYRDLWDSLNAERGYGWDVNPWVWVVEFRRAEALKAVA